MDSRRRTALTLRCLASPCAALSYPQRPQARINCTLTYNLLSPVSCLISGTGAPLLRKRGSSRCCTSTFPDFNKNHTIAITTRPAEQRRLRPDHSRPRERQACQPTRDLAT
ncbi:hypothetical protein EDB80DRAFT_696662 [Ilyonectria destructans]|nr:hypothetical protein EDB80DRAFT_696662 [Ilyonectria destructans]